MKFSIISLVILLFQLPSFGKSGAFEKSIVQVTVYSQAPDFDAPWRDKQVRSSHYLGVMVNKDEILLSAHAVAYHSMVEINFIGESDKIPMDVVKVDFNANLAIIKPKEKNILDFMVPLSLGDDLSFTEQTTLLFGKRKQKLYESPARLREVGIRQVSTSSYVYTHYLFEVRQTKGLGWSEPLVDTKGRLVALSVGQDSDILYAIPVKIIKHFLSDWQFKTYRGFTMIGISIRPLDSPHLRKYLKVNENDEGVLVSKVFANSPFANKLEPMDIIAKFGDSKIYGNGFYEHKLWGKVHFIDLLSNYFAGDEVTLEIIRRGKKIKLKGKTRAYDQQEFLIPGYPYNGVPHLIFGGFLFQELNLGFLKTWGNSWQKRAPEEMVYKYKYGNPSAIGGESRIVILNRVLPDPHNLGYQSLSNIILEKVNGHKVSSLEGLRKALAQPENQDLPLARFEFSAASGEIILDYGGMKASHQRIAKNYHITGDKSFFRNK